MSFFNVDKLEFGWIQTVGPLRLLQAVIQRMSDRCFAGPKSIGNSHLQARSRAQHERERERERGRGREGERERERESELERERERERES